jgi:hypothetical protein
MPDILIAFVGIAHLTLVLLLFCEWLAERSARQRMTESLRGALVVMRDDHAEALTLRMETRLSAAASLSLAAKQEMETLRAELECTRMICRTIREYILAPEQIAQADVRAQIETLLDERIEAIGAVA